MDSSASPSSPPSKTPEKRKRLSLACNVCRRKKIKCDGDKPTCGKCKKFNLECVYTSSVKKRGPRQGHIDLLEQRLKKMEELITSQPSRTVAADTPVAKTPPINGTSDTTKGEDLPPKEAIIELVDVYFKYFEVLSPISDIQGVKAKVRNNVCNQFLLYCILSVAARFSNNPNIAKYPLWTSGERFAKKAREMIGKVIEEPTIEHAQGLLILTLNEYGLARESRCWMYSGIAIRMVLELGFHKELVYDETPGVVIPIDRWFWYESRRRLFWEAFLQEKIISASTGRPQMMNFKDCDLLLPTYDTSLDFSKNKLIEIYQRNKDWTKLIRYTTCRNDVGEVVGIQITPIDISSPGQHPLFDRIELKSNMTELYIFLGKIAELINRGYKGMDLCINKDIEKLNQGLDLWESRLRPDQKYTQANLERYRNESTAESGQFFLGHLCYNALIVLLNRGSLVIAEMPKFDSTAQELQDEIIQNKNRCLKAAANVTYMLSDFVSKFDAIPPACIYLTYITATVVVNSSFSMDAEECKRAEEALNQYYKFFEGMKLYWATSEKMFFLMRDLYALHKKVISAHYMNNPSGNQSIISFNTTSEENSSHNSSVMNNDSLIRRLPLADIALSSSTNWLINNQHQHNTDIHMAMEQELPQQFQSSSNTIRRNPIDIYSASSGFTSFDVWLEQQQGNKRTL